MKRLQFLVKLRSKLWALQIRCAVHKLLPCNLRIHLLLISSCIGLQMLAVSMSMVSCIEEHSFIPVEKEKEKRDQTFYFCKHFTFLIPSYKDNHTVGCLVDGQEFICMQKRLIIINNLHFYIHSLVFLHLDKILIWSWKLESEWGFALIQVFWVQVFLCFFCWHPVLRLQRSFRH